MGKPRNQDIPISACNIGQLVVRLGNYRRMCEGYQAKIDLILMDNRSGEPTRRILLTLRSKKDHLEHDMKIIRKRLARLRESVGERPLD